MAISIIKRPLKSVLQGLGLLAPYHEYQRKRGAEKALRVWEKQGQPVPPPHIVKSNTILAYANTYKSKVLVETGTYKGDMIQAVKEHFESIYSIELGQDLFLNAQKRFASNPKIKLIHGDSQQEIANLVQTLTQPTLFWLDAHYSGGITARGQIDTPIYDELDAIFTSKMTNYVILIDDARCFGTQAHYPSLEELEKFIHTRSATARMTVEHDIIRITQ